MSEIKMKKFPLKDFMIFMLGTVFAVFLQSWLDTTAETSFAQMLFIALLLGLLLFLVLLFNFYLFASRRVGLLKKCICI